jgi:tetratricopeptide (TPR) repeat protein
MRARFLGIVGAVAVAWSAAQPVAAAEPAAPATSATSATSASSADPTNARPADKPVIVWAQKLFEEGSQAYNLGNFELAIQKFEAAYDLTQAVELLYNIAMAYSKRHVLDPDLDHLRKARLLFENFANIREANGEDLRDARERVVNLDLEIARIEAEQREAERREAELRAAERREAERREAERRAAVQAIAPPVPIPYRPGRLGVAGYASLGAGLLVGSGLMTAGFVSVARLADQHAAEVGPLAIPGEREALYDAHFARARTLGFAGVGVGAAVTLAAVVMIVVDARRGRRAGRRASLGPLGVAVAF